MDIRLIKAQIQTGAYRWLQHALQRNIERDIAEGEAVEAALNGEIIEEHPKDKYGPSCLILGETLAERPSVSESRT